MLSASGISVPAAAVADAKAYLRVELADEDALLARLIGSSAETCEHFTGRRLLARTFAETLPASAAWRRLAASPVRAITAVEAIASDGTASALTAGSYAIDIDAAADGWVRITARTDATKVRVTYEAGIAEASDWSGLPESLRQGVLRLAAHCYAHRDDAEGVGPPAAVSALWRPWRRMRIG